MRALGADVVEFGRDFDEARERVEELQRANGLRSASCGSMLFLEP